MIPFLAICRRCRQHITQTLDEGDRTQVREEQDVKEQTRDSTDIALTTTCLLELSINRKCRETKTLEKAEKTEKVRPINHVNFAILP